MRHIPTAPPVTNTTAHPSSHLARIVHNNRVGAAHKDFGDVLVHGALAVAHVRHVLDHDTVVRVFVLLHAYRVSERERERERTRDKERNRERYTNRER